MRGRPEVLALKWTGMGLRAITKELVMPISVHAIISSKKSN